MHQGWRTLAAAAFLLLAAGCLQPTQPTPPLPDASAGLAQEEAPATPDEIPPVSAVSIITESEETDLDGGTYRWRAAVWPAEDLPEGYAVEWRIAGNGGGTLAEGQGRSFSYRAPEMRAFHVAARVLGPDGSVAASGGQPVTMYGMVDGETRCLPATASYESVAPGCLPFPFPVPAHATGFQFSGIASEWREEYTGTVHVLDPSGDLEARVANSRVPGYENWWWASFSLRTGTPAGDWQLKWAPNQAVLGEMSWGVTVVSEARETPPALQAWMRGGG
jgi:hypothetical protein